MPLSKITQVGKLLNNREIAAFIPILSRPLIVEEIRMAIDHYRAHLIQNDQAADVDELVQQIVETLTYLSTQKTQPVINATGIIVHTNLGRSPLSRVAWRETEEMVCRYSNLEFDLTTGKRGERMGILSKILSAHFGGEANLIVNNNAAAIYLILKAFAVGKEVVVSRGEQVQIGGGFRVPDILEESGAILRNVGTTNITTLDDYLNAINENTAIVLIVHQSNYYIEGFTESVDVNELAAQLPPHVLLVVDQGSGNQINRILDEPTVSYYLKAEADIVCFSGDKMLGGPQSGIILGKKNLIKVLAKHPMMRVFRPGKETYSLIENILLHRMNRDGKADNRIEEIIEQPLSWHKERAQMLADSAPDHCQLIRTKFLVGGGTTPKAQYDTWAVMINTKHSATEVINQLRHHQPPIMGVLRQNKAILYPVTLLSEEEIETVKNCLVQLTKEDNDQPR